jgi:hypothetical protein
VVDHRRLVALVVHGDAESAALGLDPQLDDAVPWWMALDSSSLVSRLASSMTSPVEQPGQERAGGGDRGGAVGHRASAVCASSAGGVASGPAG